MTLILKILAPLVVLLSALMQAGLDYFWTDHQTKTHQRAKRLLLLLMIAGGICSIGVVVTDNQDNKALLKEFISLEAKLNPFLDLAKARFPGLDSGAALNRLSAEIKELEDQTKKLKETSIDEKTNRLELVTQLEVEKTKIRDLGVDLTVDFSGEWSEEPWGFMVSSVADEFYIFLHSEKDKSNPPVLKFYATQPYRFSTTGKGQARFQSHQAIKRGETPLGDSVSVLNKYDIFGLWIPFINQKALITHEITISRIEMVFTFNGKQGKPFILKGPFKALVKSYGQNTSPWEWAGLTQPFNTIAWNGMWSN